jgi:hypothetical protein
MARLGPGAHEAVSRTGELTSHNGAHSGRLAVLAASLLSAVAASLPPGHGWSAFGMSRPIGPAGGTTTSRPLTSSPA